MTRVAVVTGGANGIGSAIVERLRSDGLAVASLDREVPSHHRPGVLDLLCELAEPDTLVSALAEVRKSLGPPSVVVHCAAFQAITPLDVLALDVWSATFRVNVDSAFHLVKETLHDLRAAGCGRIVFITSSSYYAPPRGMAHYIASKGALTGFARGLAVDLGDDGITVNTVAPGLTATENALRKVPPEHFEAVRSRQAVPRTGRPGDIAAAVAFLVSEQTAFVTGQTLLVDGGESHL